MKRFYKEVSVIPSPERGGSEALASGEGSVLHRWAIYQILLDSRPIKTPKRAPLALPSQALAEAVATEWRNQGEEVKPRSMHLTKLANTAIDRVAGREAETVEKIVAYSNDLLCYRAQAPEELAARQAAAWDPLLAWAAERYGVRFHTGSGLAYIAQPPETLAALRQALAALDAFRLTALANAAPILGSVVLTLALAEARLEPETAFAVSQLDERYQAEKWGEDPEAAARAQALATELSAAARFFHLLSSP